MVPEVFEPLKFDRSYTSMDFRYFQKGESGRVAQLVARLSQEPEVPSSIPGPVTYFRFSSAELRMTSVNYW